MPTHLKPLSFASRTTNFQESVIREMTRLGDETEAVNLSQGLPDFDPPEQVVKAAIQAMQAGENQYSFPFGLPEFRQAIAMKTTCYNRISTNPESDITVTCGVSEAIMATILALTDPGDEVIILEPWYENYLPACLMAGAIPRFVPLCEPDYNFDERELRAAFNPRTRLILINTPHNPTGRVFSVDELKLVANLCQAFGVIAVTDEIYEHILYDGEKHISIGSLEGMQDRTVTISGLGKSYAVTGWRVGWAVACSRLSAMIRKTHDYLTVCAPAPFQWAGVTALNLPESYYQQIISQYHSARSQLMSALDAAGMTYRIPQGAYYIMADFKSLNWDEATYAHPGWSPSRCFAEMMARHVGVAVVPGASFYYRGHGGQTRVRFNFAKRPETLKEAAKHLAKLAK